MVMQVQQRYYSPEEYLALEVNAEERHIYIDGEIIETPGGTPNHNKIAGNLSAALNFALKRQPYQVFAVNQRLWVPDLRSFTYPDVMVIAQPIEFMEGRKDTLTNPLIVAEILSNSTEGYDRGQKFAACRSISSLQEYVLIDQYAMHVEHYAKADDRKWIFCEYEGEDSVLTLASVLFQISLADLYDKVDFSSEEPRAIDEPPADED
ncbi:MAG: Uma2 family endonuclease [Leptolyngbyaceae cyanobacterium SM1_3_5]|nr:Uma2 family endonuclease [Leptolyngbyaceae cyanobacterium SM1_3_5]